MKKNKKSPFLGYSDSEVNKMERKYFCLHFGGDFVCEDGHYIFTRREIITLYNRTLSDLIGIIKDGSQKDRAYALDLLLGLFVRPMRLH